jgi:hypothetical protein
MILHQVLSKRAPGIAVFGVAMDQENCRPGAAEAQENIDIAAYVDGLRLEGGGERGLSEAACR